MIQFSTAKAIDCKRLAGKFYSFIFETQMPLEFKPGQYISVKVSDDRINSYSLIDQDEANRFSLLVDTTPGGPGSKYFENLKVGDVINFLGPFGTFIYNPDDKSNHLLFLGTGSGCVPLRTIIDDLLRVKKTTIPITLYFGLRYNSDIFWREYYDKLSKEYSNFHFNLVLSKPDENWQGKTGHITNQVVQDFPDASDCSVYLCGNQMMVEEAKKILISHGLAKEKIYTERF